MKIQSTFLILSALLLSACSSDQRAAESADTSGSSGAGTVAESSSAAAQPGGNPASLTELSGKVVETMDGGGYTYLRVDTGEGELWAAGAQRALAVGDQVTCSGLMLMSNFESTSLERTFEAIYFCSSVTLAGEQPAGAQGMGGHGNIMGGDILGGNSMGGHGTSGGGAAQQPAADITVEPVEGGQTVEQIFTEREKYVGKEIVVRAQVVKFLPQIMGTNWLHLQDGTGGKGTNDLTITCSTSVEVGDVVTVRGTLVADKDFGYGYKYDLIVEDAQVAKD